VEDRPLGRADTGFEEAPIVPDPPHRPVLLSEGPGRDASHLEALSAAAERAADDLPGAAVELARSYGAGLPLPGHGATLELWESLATLAAVDLSAARILEPHLDALAILAESGAPPPDDETTWGVYAAEGPGVRLTATRHDGGWVLDGTKPWCSLAGHLSHALVTAWVDDRQRSLFAVDMSHEGVRPEADAWHARGLPTVTSGPVGFSAVPAEEIGGPGWYLRRDGFAWGGMGVAAVWYGGTVGVARRLLQAAGQRPPDQVALMHLGTVDTALTGARTMLAHAACLVDDGQAGGETGALLALRVRQVVADAAETVLRSVDHGLGPAPLALEPEHAGRVADLRLYLRQHHAERDLAALGQRVVGALEDEGSPW
jgi:alkylation response protein AidB-like acyl-CoA dehydrogenase